VGIGYVDEATLLLVNNLCIKNMTVEGAIAETTAQEGADPSAGAKLKYYLPESGESMKYEIVKAITELHEAYQFLEAIAELTPKEMFEKIEERDKSFIEHIEIMEEPPKSASDFWKGFSIWTISRLRNKYHRIWHQVLDS